VTYTEPVSETQPSSGHVTFSTCDDPATYPFEYDERAVTDDRRWFVAHPRRCHRIRRPGIRERQTLRGQHPQMRCYVVVRQIGPGVRLRQPAWLTGSVPNLEPIAHAVFDLVLEAAITGTGFVPPDVVHQRILMLAEARRA
jgi:hypothetical protein